MATKTYCGYSLEAPRRGAFHAFPQHMFTWRYNKNYLLDTPSCPLRKHAYSNILKILQPKKENFQIKNF